MKPASSWNRGRLTSLRVAGSPGPLALSGTPNAQGIASDWALERLVLATALGASLLVLLRNAWAAEDAYVTLRCVDNLVNGYGLRWNVAERVQAYSNPLWLLSLVPIYWLFEDPYPTVLVGSLICCCATVFVCIRAIAYTRASALLGIALLTSSRAFVEYSTSGLENPLTHLLLALFFSVHFTQDPGPRRLFWMTLLASLLSVNRLDCALLSAPALALSFLQAPQRGRLRSVGAGALPLASWLTFSLVYYGFWFPNTAYAKLNTGLDRGEVLAQGALYYANLLSQDPLSLLVIGVAFATPFLFRTPRVGAPLCGVGLYLVYIVSIGGDFMSGRFFSAPLFVASVVLMRVPLDGFRTGVGAAVAAAGLSFLGPHSPLTSGADVPFRSIERTGIADERAYYYSGSGLLRILRSSPFPDNGWVHEGIRDRKIAESRSEKLIVQRTNVGFHGFFAGPQVHVIDPLALGDPLPARMPATFEPLWRVGHYERVIPDGYHESILNGLPALSDPKLNEYYEALFLVTRGELWSRARWEAIFGFMLGQFDHLIDKQRYRFADPLHDRKPLSWDALTSASPSGELPEPTPKPARLCAVFTRGDVGECASAAPESFLSQVPVRKNRPQPVASFSGQSLLIQSEVRRLRDTLQFTYASPRPSKLFFLLGTSVVGSVALPPVTTQIPRTERVEVPKEARTVGFDALYFRGERGVQHRLFGLE